MVLVRGPVLLQTVSDDEARTAKKRMQLLSVYVGREDPPSD